MKPRGILFSAPMVKAILAGTKTQTRRIAKCDWMYGPDGQGYLRAEDVTRFAPETGHSTEAAAYPIGSICYVKETHYRWGKWVKSGLTKKGKPAWRFKAVPYPGIGPGILWAADCLPQRIKRNKVGWHKRPSIFMPKLPARIWLEVTGVRVERLNSITADDAIAEGLEPGLFGKTFRAPGYALDRDAVGAYEALWEFVNGKGSWAANPLVFVYEFRRIERPKDL